MDNPKMAVVGIGATGAVLAAALLKQDPETVLVDPGPGLQEAGISVPFHTGMTTLVRAIRDSYLRKRQ